MKKNLASFILGLLIGCTPVIHVAYITMIISAFEIGKHWPW